MPCRCNVPYNEVVFEVEFPEEVDNMMNKNYYVLLVLTQEFFCLSILTEGSDW